MADKQAIDFTAGMKAEAAAAYLEALAAGLRAGHIFLQADSELAYLDVAPDLTVDIEAKSTPNKGKSSVEISLSWRLDKRQATPPPSLTITSDAAPPEPPEPAAMPEPEPESISFD